MKKFYLLFGLFSFVLAPTVFAGGGRIEIDVLDPYGVVDTQPVRVQAKISKEDYSGPSVGEKAEFRLVNPRSGDYCTTYSNQADTNGYIRGECGASQAGGLTMFVHSLDVNTDSYTVFFQIHEPVQNSQPDPNPEQSPPATVLPTTVPTPPPTERPAVTISLPESSPTPVATASGVADTQMASQEGVIEENATNTSLNWPSVFTQMLLLLSGVAAVILMMLILRSASPRIILLVATITFLFAIAFVYASMQSRSQTREQQMNFEATQSQGGLQPEESNEVVQESDSMQIDTSSPTSVSDPQVSPAPLIPQTITVTIKGTIYNDANCNYKRDNDESPLSTASVNVVRYNNGSPSIIATVTTDNSGLYTSSHTIKPSETLVLQPNPYKNGFSIVTMSGLPQQVHLSSGQKVVVQDLPMIASGDTARCP